MYVSGPLRAAGGQTLPAPKGSIASTSRPPHRRLTQQDEYKQDVCAFFRTGLGSETDEVHWGRCAIFLVRRCPAMPYKTLQVLLFSVMPQNTGLIQYNIDVYILIRTNLCNIPEGARWADKAAARCHSCLPEEAHSNLCQDAPELLIHQYLNRLDPDNPQGNLLSLKAYLMTQARP